jgi:hypothetical protein
MPRQDGRIEPGQKLSKAISARAWNRAQEAADIVLGRPQALPGDSKLIPGQLVVPCYLTTPVTVGTVVTIRPGLFPPPGNAPNHSASDTFTPFANRIYATVAQPVPFVDIRTTRQTPLGVVIAGATLPSNGNPGFVQVCIAGLCVAKVRYRYGAGNFIRAPVLREPTDTSENLYGVADESDCGPGRIIHYFFNPISAGPPEIRYAAVLL